MGCDIHCFVEKKFKVTSDQKNLGIKQDRDWIKITNFVSDYYDPNCDYFKGDNYKHADSPIDGRNYDMFAIMADVRNGHGVAGCDTGNPIVPIAEPKGLPTDVSQAVLKEAEEWGCDGHSHSYLTIAEIMDYDRTRNKVQRAYVDADNYRQFLDNGKPSMMCGDVYGINVVKCSPEDILVLQKTDPTKTYYCQIEWLETAEECASQLFGDALTQLKERCDSSNFDDVRLVFWFDN